MNPTVRFTKSRNQTRLTHSKNEIINEIEQAKMEWVCAQQKLDYALENDQIDYAIFALEAAQKRYEMLIRQAKKMELHLLHDKGENV